MLSEKLDYANGGWIDTRVDETSAGVEIPSDVMTNSLGTIKWGSGLSANFNDTLASAKLTDPAPVVLREMLTEPQVNYSFLNAFQDAAQQAQVPPVETQPGVGIQPTNANIWDYLPGNPLKIFSNKDIQHETFLFVIGAIILAFGIYALVK